MSFHFTAYKSVNRSTYIITNGSCFNSSWLGSSFVGRRCN